MPSRHIVILGLAVTSSWGNGHATTYRGLMRELHARGHTVLFLERDVPWYREYRDLPAPPYGRVELYMNLEELRTRHAREIADADFVIIGSYVPEAIELGNWVQDLRRGPTAFYDIDTPVTLAAVERGDCTYLDRALMARYDLYLSFTAGPTLRRLEHDFGVARARALYCSADTGTHYPQEVPARWDLGYLGTYAPDRQGPLEQLLLEPARRWPDGRFAVAGPSYPERLAWPSNCEHIPHLAPDRHREYYNAQRYALNLTRADMRLTGYSPSVRLFEAAACGTPIVSDVWQGLDSLFRIGSEILVAQDASTVLEILRGIPEDERRRLGERGRARILTQHTAAHRAAELEHEIEAVLARQPVFGRARINTPDRPATP